MAIEKFSDTTTKQRDVRVKVPWPDVKRVLADAAMKHVGMAGDRGAATIKVELHEEKRDSGAYGTCEWYAFVTVTVPLD